MDLENRSSATRMLARAQAGDGDAASSLFPLVYAELRALAASYLARERTGHTLQPTALVHEAWLRIFDAEELDELDRTHFLAIAANVMRRVLVEHARARAALRRGGGAERATLTLEGEAAPEPEVDLLALDEAIEQLGALDPRHARIVELRYFAGLTVADVARVLGASKRAIEADWTLARAWLRRRLSPS